MDFIGIILLSAALSTDALNIGLTCGVGGVRISRLSRLIILLVSSGVTSAAVVAGELLRGVVPPVAGKAVGAALMVSLGIYMSLGGIKRFVKGRAQKRKLHGKDGHGKMAGEVGMIGRAVACDTDGSKTIDCKEAVMIGAGLSADSFAAGLGAGISTGAGLLLPVLCGVFQMLFLRVGEQLSGWIRRSGRLDPDLFAVGAGLVLIITAVIRLAL